MNTLTLNKPPVITGTFSVYHLTSPEGSGGLYVFGRMIAMLSINSKVNLAALVWNACLAPDDERCLGAAYVPAADIDLDFVQGTRNYNQELSQCFELTNSTDTSWSVTDNPRVRPTGASRRSTSVGDIIVAYGGVPFLVDSVGFLALPMARFFNRR